MNALEFFQAGRLRDAIDACITATKARPADPGPRDLLVQLLCFTGDWQRADKHLETLTVQCPDRVPAIALIRQLLRAAEAREQFFTEGRCPEPIVELSPVARLHLEAAVHLRENDAAGALDILADAEARRPRLSGMCNDVAFHDFRDADDLLTPVFEVLTSSGKYAWVPMESVVEMTLFDVESPLDILWRRTQMVVRGGPDGDVYLPQLYFGSHATGDEELQVGRAADWNGDAHNPPVRGVGQKIMMVDDSCNPLVSVRAIRFDGASS